MGSKKLIVVMGILLGSIILVGFGVSAYLLLDIHSEKSNIVSDMIVEEGQGKVSSIESENIKKNMEENSTNNIEQVAETDEEEGTKNYIVTSGQCGDSLNWDIDVNGVLTIRGTGEMWNFAQDEEGEEKNYERPEAWVPEQKGKSNGIRAIIIEEGVTSIGNFAFWGFDEMESVSIPDSVLSIGRAAFSRCSIKGKLVLPKNITEIGESAFSRCPDLESVTIPEGVTTLNEEIFLYCHGLKELYLPKSITDIRSKVCFSTALEDIYFAGDESEWEELEYFDNEELDQAVIHYKSENSMY